MASITTRVGKGSPLTTQELDANFNNLNTDKIEKSTTVEKSDLGTAPNEVPLNQYLGELAYQNKDQFVIRPVASATPYGLGELCFQLTDNTTLVVKARGSDGIVRSATLTLA